MTESADPTPENDTLSAALTRQGLTLDPSTTDKLEAFARALWDWNERINLTRHTTWEKFVSRDVVDAHQLNSLVPQGASVLDVGTGGGVPGVVMWILRPDLQMTVCDPVGKKAKAVTEMMQRCQFPVRVLSERAEQIVAREAFDALVVRAVAPLTELLGWFYPVWENIGRLLIVKGPKWLDERADARHKGKLHQLELRKAASYPLPGTESESVILKLWPKGLPEPE
jgi:16S rRNA (guanine527-N7)-methyltransferase